jgi:hypothetical protein
MVIAMAFLNVVYNRAGSIEHFPLQFFFLQIVMLIDNSYYQTFSSGQCLGAMIAVIARAVVLFHVWGLVFYFCDLRNFQQCAAACCQKLTSVRHNCITE